MPAGTKSLALIVDDPDAPDPAAPKMTWVHWVLYAIPPTAGGLPEAVVSSALPAGTREGVNDWKRTGYGGPCPPIGRHRYFHKLYALDTVVPDLQRADKAAVEKRCRDTWSRRPFSSVPIRSASKLRPDVRWAGPHAVGRAWRDSAPTVFGRSGLLRNINLLIPVPA